LSKKLCALFCFFPFDFYVALPENSSLFATVAFFRRKSLLFLAFSRYSMCKGGFFFLVFALLFFNRLSLRVGGTFYHKKEVSKKKTECTMKRNLSG
jgi:hypothetical protein